MRTKEIYNQDQTKLAYINRELFTDGYNYYVTLLVLNVEHNVYFIDDRHKQAGTITSYKNAIQYANNLLNN